MSEQSSEGQAVQQPVRDLPTSELAVPVDAPDDTPVGDLDVDAARDEQETDESAARSFGQEGTDADPASFLNL